MTHPPLLLISVLVWVSALMGPCSNTECSMNWLWSRCCPISHFLRLQHWPAPAWLHGMHYSVLKEKSPRKETLCSSKEVEVCQWLLCRYIRPPLCQSHFDNDCKITVCHCSRRYHHCHNKLRRKGSETEVPRHYACPIWWPKSTFPR